MLLRLEVTPLDNILIELSGKEPPVMDGSAKDFVEC